MFEITITPIQTVLKIDPDSCSSNPKTLLGFFSVF